MMLSGVRSMGSNVAGNQVVLQDGVQLPCHVALWGHLKHLPIVSLVCQDHDSSQLHQHAVQEEDLLLQVRKSEY